MQGLVERRKQAPLLLHTQVGAGQKKILQLQQANLHQMRGLCSRVNLIFRNHSQKGQRHKKNNLHHPKTNILPSLKLNQSSKEIWSLPSENWRLQQRGPNVLY